MTTECRKIKIGYVRAAKIQLGIIDLDAYCVSWLLKQGFKMISDTLAVHDGHGGIEIQIQKVRDELKSTTTYLYKVLKRPTSWVDALLNDPQTYDYIQSHWEEINKDFPEEVDDDIRHSFCFQIACQYRPWKYLLDHVHFA